MRWQFWQKSAPQKLSGDVKKSLLKEFPLDPQLAERIRYLGRKGLFSGRRAEYIRIFDPDLIGDRGTAAPTYDGLLETDQHRGALLFEGRIETIYESEQVFLTDRRVA